MHLFSRKAWAYMYDGSLGGIDTHADDCQVQINFFISPSSANLWLENKSLPSGGLVLYGVGPPAEWNYTDYNSIVQNPRIDEILRTTNYWNVTIPYVENRAVLFDSTYFHKTDCMRFKKGYKNRRINDARPKWGSSMQLRLRVRRLVGAP